MTADDTRLLVHRFLDALNAHDLAAASAMLAEDAAYDPPHGTREIGSGGARDLMAAAPRETIGDIVVMTDETGARAAAEFTRRGNAAGTARSYSARGGFFFEIDGGRITRLTAVAPGPGA